MKDLPTNPPLFSICYWLRATHEWITIENLDLESSNILLEMLEDLRRKVRIRNQATGEILPPFLLHLFYIPLSDRKIQNAVSPV